MTIKTLLLILIMVESGGNPEAIGDNGKALGVLQIHAAYVEDVNRIYGTTYKHQDALCRDTSIEIATLYLSYYGSPERLGRNPTVRDLALIHQGGPNGYRRTNRTAENYMQKVRFWAKELNVILEQ